MIVAQSAAVIEPLEFFRRLSIRHPTPSCNTRLFGFPNSGDHDILSGRDHSSIRSSLSMHAQVPLDEDRAARPLLRTTLPPELEREIFLLTARSYRGVSTRLMLVASHVKAWIEPWVYKTVILRGPGHAFRFVAALAHRSPQFVRSHVKALCVRPTIPLSLTIQLLSACSGIESLALWISPQSDTTELINVVASLPLKFLSLNLMFILQQSSPKSVLQNHPVFVNLTHLDIVNHWWLWTSSHGIEHLPLLTHVAFRFWLRGSIDAALLMILNESPKLEVLILLADSVVILGAKEYLEKEGIRDGRVVVLKHTRDAEEWEAMERDEEGMWQRAESVVRWRRRNKAGPFDFPPDFPTAYLEATTRTVARGLFV